MEAYRSACKIRIHIIYLVLRHLSDPFGAAVSARLTAARFLNFRNREIFNCFIL